MLSHDSAALSSTARVPDPTVALVPRVTVGRRSTVDAVRAGVEHHLAPCSTHAGTGSVDRPACPRRRPYGARHGARARCWSPASPCSTGASPGATAARPARPGPRTMWCWPFSSVMARRPWRCDHPGAESWLESEGRVLVLGLGIGRPQTQFGTHRRPPHGLVRPPRRAPRLRSMAPSSTTTTTSRPSTAPGPAGQKHVTTSSPASARRFPDHRETTTWPGGPPPPEAAAPVRRLRTCAPVRHRHHRPGAVHRPPPPLTTRPTPSQQVGQRGPPACNARVL